MEIGFQPALAERYHSHSQKARVLTEDWAARNLYCPRCGNPILTHFENNRAVADFYCEHCRNEYELKSKQGSIGHKIADGAYETFIQRITGNHNPDFFVMIYQMESLCVSDLWVIPRHFFTPAVVEKRKPLAQTARRAGWVGCNILFDEIPAQGRISVVQNGIPVRKEDVLEKVRISTYLATENLEARGWLFDVLNCVNRIRTATFSLNEVYRFDEALKARHPHNCNIRPKIRQQLQILRDRGVLEFLGRGQYRKLI